MLIEAFGLSFQNPILLAAGTAGFGREVAGVTDLESLGGLITKAVSPEPRKGNAAPRVAEFSGGMLNSVGLANPGLDAIVESELPWLEQHVSTPRVIVNVVGDRPADYVEVVKRLSGAAAVHGFELNVSCPNTDRGGEEFGSDSRVLGNLISAAIRETTKPLIVKLAPTLPDIVATARIALEAGAAGLSLVNTIPGFLFRQHGTDSRLGRGQGGVSGPALLPIGVHAVRKVVEATGATVIGVGGVSTIDHVWQYLRAGATLVAVGTAALASPKIPEQLARKWQPQTADV